MTRMRPGQLSSDGASNGDALLWNSTTGKFEPGPVLSTSLYNAKGDLLVGTADNTLAVLSSDGTNGHVLTIDTSTATGLKWASAGAAGITVQDENGNVGTGITQIDFQGAGVTATAGTGETIITIPGGTGGHTIEDETTGLTARTKLSFQGAGVTATDDSGNDRTIVTVPGYTDEQARDAIGTALTAGSLISKTVDDPGDTITIAVDLTNLDERIRDTVAATLVAGTNMTVTNDDAGNTITLASTGGGGGTSLHCKANTLAGSTSLVADLAATPYEDSLQISVNGVILEPGSGNDYTVSGTTVTFASGVFTTGDKVRFRYWTTTSSAADTAWHYGTVGAGGVPAAWSAVNTNPVMPSGATIGETAILEIVSYSRLGGVSVPTASGWTLVGSNTNGTPDGGAVRITAFKKTVGSGEPGNAVTVGYPGDAGATSYGAITSYSNVSSIGTPSYQYTVSGSTPNSPLTTTVNNTLIVHVVMTYRSNGGATLNITEPGGVTHRFGGNNGDTHGAADLCDEVKATPGAASTRTFTNDGGIGAVMDIPVIPV